MKLLLILGALMGGRGLRGISLQDLSKETGIPQSTVHRLLQMLVSHGMAIQTTEQRYSVGPALLALGLSVAEEWGLKSVAQVALGELAAEVQEEAYLTMRIGYTGVFIERCASPRPIRVIEPLFEKLPLHCGASRKVLLAHGGDEFIEDYLAQGGLERFTENTITDPDALRVELAKIRDRGYGVSKGERSLEIAGVAAPVFGPWGRVIASVSTLLPATSIQNGRREQEIAAHVQHAAAEIADRLGDALPG